MKVVCCTALLLGLLISPASAGTINVSINPVSQYVPLAAGTAQVEIRATIAEADAIFGWGMDLNLSNANVSFTSADVVINNLLFDPATSMDGDGLAGLVQPPAQVWGTNILLATVILTLNAEGITYLTPGDSNPAPFVGDLSEGFSIDPDPGFANMVYTGGSITTPEPTALTLLALGGLALLRRR
jgi:MYXO-CTERM domain-containing protein